MDATLTEPAAGPATAGTGPGSGTATPATAHRIIIVLTAVTLFIGLRDLWTATIIQHPPVAALMILSYALILACAVAAVAVRRARTLLAAEVVLLGVGVLHAATYFFTKAHTNPPYSNDEGTLVQAAAHGLLNGVHVYGSHFKTTGVITQLMGGGFVNTFGYPPLSVVLTAPVAHLFPHLPAAGVVSMTALIVSGVAMFLLLPAAWRSTATLVCFGIGDDLLMSSARQGYPALVALPFLIVVVAGWTRVGRGGRLGRFGVLRAVCFGLAAAAQQLAWFFAPFLLVGMFLARRRELAPRAAAKVTLRYAALSLGVFLLVNLPFIVQGPGAWLGGVFSPITQHAVPHGQGLFAISYYFSDGSGALNLYSDAALLLLIALLALLAFFPTRVGPAVTILPWISFFLSTRSQDGYYTLMVPIWLMSVLTTQPSDFSDAGVAAWLRRWGTNGPGRIWDRIGSMRVWAVLLPLAATAVCLLLAVVTPPPLRMSVSSVRAGATADTVAGLTVTVTNRSGAPVRPQFALTTKGPSLTRFWTVTQGPATLAAHQSATYVLTTPGAPYKRGPRGHVTLSAVSDAPMTISTTDVPKH